MNVSVSRELVAHWMTRDVVSVAPEAPLFEALELMADRRIRHVLVLAEGELAGIVSNRDVLRATALDVERRLDLHATSAGDVMTPVPLHTTRPGASLAEAAALMHGQRISALPVLEAGRLVGILTSEDVLAAVSVANVTPRRPDA